MDSLRSATFTQRYGTTPSIMDYARFNYVAQPGDKGVKLTPPDLGPYDYYAIGYAYRPLPDKKDLFDEEETLRGWIDEKAGDPMYRYGRQQLVAQMCIRDSSEPGSNGSKSACDPVFRRIPVPRNDPARESACREADRPPNDDHSAILITTLCFWKMPAARAGSKLSAARCSRVRPKS